MLSYFVRQFPDAGFYVPQSIKLLLLVGFFLSVGLGWKFRHSKRALKIGMALLVVHQLVMLGWYLHVPFIFLKEGLPLYHCRIAMLGLVITFLMNKRELMTFFAEIGICGSIVAFVIPDPDPFFFPHITNFTFSFGHFFLAFVSAIVLCHEKSLLPKQILKYVVCMNSFILVVNMCIHANYGFLVKLPPVIAQLPIHGVMVPIVVTTCLFLVLLSVNSLMFWSEERHLASIQD